MPAHDPHPDKPERTGSDAAGTDRTGSVHAAPGPARLPKPVRLLLIALAALFLAIGVVGIVVPGLPTTVFVLLAAWCAARGSPRLHGWLLAHRLFGPMIRDWQDGGRVSRRAKRSAALAMGVCAVLLILTTPGPWAAFGIVVMAVVLVWLWQRPEH